MIGCYILLKVEAKKESKVFKALHSMKEVEGIQEVFGQYDIIVKVSSPDMNSLRGFIINRIRSVEGVVESTTLITSEGEK